MGDKPVIMIIGTECSPEWEEEWSKWYSEKHLPDMFYSCNAKKATRYKIISLTEAGEITLSRNERSGEAGYAPYIAIYDFENWGDVIGYYTGAPRVPQVEEWNRDWVSKGAGIVWRIFYEPIKTWDTGAGVGDKPVVMIIGTECSPEWEKEWSEWYTDKHLPDMFKFEGVKKAARYKIKTPTEADGIVPTQDERTGKVSYAPYIATYEFDNWEAIKVYNASGMRNEIVQDWNKNWTPKGARIVWRIFYEPIGTWEK